MKSTDLFRYCLLIIFLSFSNKVNATSEPDDILKKGIFDTYHYQMTEQSAESFKQWFFSTDFEKEIKNNSTNLSVTVPIEGFPVTFGGSHETSDAWEKRSNTANASK